jgi:hypothetical protein
MTNVEEALTNMKPILEATEEALIEYNSDENYKIPELIGAVALKLNWNEADIRANEHIVRHYVRNNKEWYVTRGAHGGAQRISVRDAKEEAKKAKVAAKADLRAAIESKLEDPIAAIAGNASDSE